MSFLGALQLAFIILKLVGVITWSWLLVLAPAIIGTAFFLVPLALVFVGATVFGLTSGVKRRRP